MFALAETSVPNREVQAQGSGFFKSSPGPLTREHRKWDNPNGCNDCHIDGTKRLSNSKCLGCHDHRDLRARINAGKGFHATAKVKGKKCESCHQEHKGRSFNQMGWRVMPGGERGFDHKLTGWPLRQKHAVLKCSECHRKRNSGGRRIYLGENRLCGACHRKDQPHKFDRRHNMKCERCHSEIAWKPRKRNMAFDHNKKSDAEFPQEGAHKDVACAKCHPKSQFNLKMRTPDDCRNCHKSSHKGHLFDRKRCSWCHSPKFRTLKQWKFNHAARTRFKLSGSHSPNGRALKCYKCHTKERGQRKPNRACETCHSKDSKHGTRFKQFGNPPRCGMCHTEGKFKGKKIFNHSKNTRFKLAGKHARIACQKCHRGGPKNFENFEKKTDHGRRCMSCHQHKGVHASQYSDLPKGKTPNGPDGKPMQTCLECHRQPGMIEINTNTKFYREIHGKAGKWPLTDNHALVACEKCHEQDAVEFKDTPTQCAVRCHKDSLHEGRLGDECDKCHQPGIWKAVRFDHTDDTEWPLLGLHETVPKCEDCHPQHPLSKKYKGVPTNCSAEGCHAKDDAHRGKLGKKCELCHLETGENIFDHNAQADFKLDGAHLVTQCSDCHPSITFKPRPKDCYGGGVCHPEPDVHKGQYGVLCNECHNTTTFKQIKPLHDVGDFSLNGQHDRLTCRRCHLDNRPLGGSGNFCINCHRQDDIHSNSLSPRCGTCHTQWSFAPAKFDHSTVGCNLTGLHRTLPCFDCHKNGNFRGLSATCFSCHIDLAQQASVQGLDASHRAVSSCSGCHNINFWTPANAAPHLRESVCL